MIDYEKLRENYVKADSHSCSEQLHVLDLINTELSIINRSMLSTVLSDPTPDDYNFFDVHFGYLIPLFIEKYGVRQDVYCLNIEDPSNKKVSVFSEDGIVHEWDSVREFITWLINDTDFLS